jgi:hypothetical protein
MNFARGFTPWALFFYSNFGAGVDFSLALLYNEGKILAPGATGKILSPERGHYYETNALHPECGKGSC